MKRLAWLCIPSVIGITILSQSHIVALGEALPVSPHQADTMSRWIDPSLRADDIWSGSELTGVVAQIIEAPSAIEVGGDVTIGVRVVNTSKSPLSTDSLQLVTRHADAEPSLHRARKVLAGDQYQFPYEGMVRPLNEVLEATLDPGEHAEFAITVPTQEQLPGSFNISEPGFYPIYVGIEDAEGNRSSQRFLLAIEDDEPSQVGLSMVLPLTTDIPIVPGETGDAPSSAPLILLNDDIAQSLSPEGELRRLLETYKESLDSDARLAQASCLAIDPQLVHVLDRMHRNGYFIAQTRPSVVSQKRRLRDSWLAEQDESRVQDMQQGRGGDDAGIVLEELTEIAQHSCTVALPWANTEINAVADTKNAWLMQEAILRGQEVLEEVLGTPGLENLVIAPNGYITETTAPALGWADRHSTAAQMSVDEQWNSLLQRPSETNSKNQTQSLTQVNPQEASTNPVLDTPQQPVRVLVADNSYWQTPESDQFAQLAPQIIGVGYDSSLAATLASAGQHPRFVGYSSLDTRVNPDMDSLQARNATASAGLRQALAGGVGASGTEAAESSPPVLAMLPVELDSQSAKEILSTASALLENSARPLGLEEYSTPNPQQLAQLQAPTEEFTGQKFGAPFDDPSVILDPEILRARQQGNYSDDLTSLMVPSEVMALTPYAFTEPLRQELLRALSYSDRSRIDTYDAAITEASDILNQNRATLIELRESVGLLPPGNVYTRISDSSPLLIVAQNGLPLPVDARIEYAGPEGSQINAPQPLIIPAKGSYTVSMTAQLPPSERRTNLSLWLATPQGAAISNPVEIGVQTRSGLIGPKGTTFLILLTLALIVMGRTFIQRRRAQHEG